MREETLLIHVFCYVFGSLNDAWLLIEYFCWMTDNQIIIDEGIEADR
jgi:hypothetical protein